MKKSKIILLSKVLIILFSLVTLLKIINYCKNYKLINNNSIDKGTVTDIKKYQEYTIIIIKGKVKYKAYINNSNNKLDIGNIISFKYSVIDLNTYKIPNSFNYIKYLKSEGIKGIINIDEFKVVGNNSIYNIKKILNNKMDKLKSKKYVYTFLSADKTYLDQDIKTYYIENGISHHLCVSGFHLVFLLSFFKKQFKKIIKKESITMALLIFITFIYLFNSNFSISLLRASLLYYSVYINKKYNINLNKIFIFVLILNISLFLYPGSIYKSSFWYSFVLSYFLMFYGQKYNSLFKINIFSYVISLPLTIYFNYQVNILAPLFGLLFFYYICYLIYPLVFLSMICSFFDVILYYLSLILEIINKYINNVKITMIIFPKMSIYVLILIYLIYLCYLNKPAIKWIIIYALIMIFSYSYIYFDNNRYLYFIDVHQGDMIVYIGKNHKNVTLIDTGGVQKDAYLKNNIKSFLHSVGVKKINSLIITHGDYDHMGEAINLVNNFRVEKVIFNCGEFNDLEQELIKVLNKKKIKYYSCIKELNIDKNKLYFLQTKEYNNENDNSNVIYTELNSYKFLFMGDASVTTEKEILDKYNLSNIDALKVGHHGSKTSSSKEFINEINPRYSIISVGKNNKYGHPNKEVLDVLKNSKIYRTDQDGSIIFAIENSKLNVRLYRH